MRAWAAWLGILLVVPAVGAEPAMPVFTLNGLLRWPEPARFSGLLTLASPAPADFAHLILDEEPSPPEGLTDLEGLIEDGYVPLQVPAAPSIIDTLTGNDLVTADAAKFVLHRWDEDGVQVPALDCPLCSNEWVAAQVDLEILGYISPPELTLQGAPGPRPKGLASNLSFPGADCRISNVGEGPPLRFPNDPASPPGSGFDHVGLGTKRLAGECVGPSVHADHPQVIRLYGFHLVLHWIEDDREKQREIQTGTFEETDGAPRVTQVLEIRFHGKSLKLDVSKPARVRLYGNQLAGEGHLRTPPAAGQISWGDVWLDGDVPSLDANGTYVFGWEPDKHVELTGLTTQAPSISLPDPQESEPPLEEESSAPSPPLETPVVTLEAAATRLSESGPPGVALVRRASNDLGWDLNVRYHVSGSAGSEDYEALPGTILIPAGESTAQIPIVPLDDVRDEANEDLRITLSRGGAFEPGAVSSLAFQIVDNDLPAVTLRPTHPEALEGGPEAAIEVERATEDAQGFLEIQYAVTGAATPGEDYEALTRTATFQPGETRTQIRIGARADSEHEPVEDIVLSIVPAATYTVGTPSSAAVSVRERPPPPLVRLAVIDAEAREDSDEATFSIARTSSDISQPLTVYFALDGTASPGQDFAPLPDSATIPSGQKELLMTVAPAGVANVAQPKYLVVTLQRHPSYALDSAHSATITISGAPSNGLAIAWIVAGGASIGGLLVLLGFLFTRLQRHQMLDHPRRAQIFEMVRNQPGVEMNTVSRALEIPWPRLVDHVKKLERAQYVKLHKVGGRTALFSANAGFRGKEAQIWLLRRETPSRVLGAVTAQPGTNQDALTASLRLSRGRISRVLQSLSLVGLVRAERDSGQFRYYPLSGAGMPSE